MQKVELMSGSTNRTVIYFYQNYQEKMNKKGILLLECHSLHPLHHTNQGILFEALASALIIDITQLRTSISF